ncbi:RusA family crossover junction endodeoxyribonuclease [Deinococcus kurensis]|uniref:RusA family crossover junction endodeoxyribonuclease n=1 Tax=Deinococcus kurensis TaxID=2662757 RepID=UPI0012D31C68|nr:RusA family crossover junction endodeoxyribonuclease [Deinococcus kurensis]
MSRREHRLTIPGRPKSTKNSRQVVKVRGKVKTVMSGAACDWMARARAEVRRAWRGRPLQTPAHIHIHAVFSNRRSLPDGDNTVNGVLDAIKGIVVIDDSLAWIPSFAFSHEVTPGAQDCVHVILTQVLP